MGLLQGIKNLINGNREQAPQQFKKVTPDEVELNSYLEEERLKNIRRRLQKYRQQKHKEMWIGNNPLNQKCTLNR